VCAPRNFVTALFREHPLLSLRAAPRRAALRRAEPRRDSLHYARSRSHKGNGVRQDLGGKDEGYFSTTPQRSATPRKVNRAK